MAFRLTSTTKEFYDLIEQEVCTGGGILNILYHFTTATNADAIKKHGLTKGVTPVNEDEKIAFIQHTQWLTIDPDAETMVGNPGWTDKAVRQGQHTCPACQGKVDTV